MRAFIALLMLMVGIALAAVSYFFLAAPLGQPIGPEYSNPRLIGAPAIFILGIVLIFLSAVVYELIPGRVTSVPRDGGCAIPPAKNPALRGSPAGRAAASPRQYTLESRAVSVEKEEKDR